MQASGQCVEIIKRHLRDGDAEFSGFVFSDFARDYGPTRKPVYCQSDYVIYGAEFCGIVV
jgi:hypothetical protein